MNGVVIGKRVPIGAAVGGLLTFGFAIWNMTHPEMQFSVLEVGALATTLTALVQVFVANCFGVTHRKL